MRRCTSESVDGATRLTSWEDVGEDGSGGEAEDRDYLQRGMGLNDFLNQVYGDPKNRQSNGRRIPVYNKIPYYDAASLLVGIKTGSAQFGEEGYAVILSPIDIMRIQQLWQDHTGVSLFEYPEQTPDSCCGLLIQGAKYMPEGHYTIVGREDFDDLTHPDNLE